MMKNINKILLFIFCLFFLTCNIKAETLKSLKEQLKKDEANQAALVRKQKDVQNKIKSAEKEINTLEKNIEDYEDEIEDLLKQIDKLNEDIKAKQKEIDSLLSFLQISNGDNIYLEYVFEAKSFTDFIYRSAVVEELTKYNDDLIDEMYNMIEEDKKLQEELKNKITQSENSIKELDKKLKNYDVSLSDLENAHSDITAEIKSRKKTIEYYESIYKANNCKEDVELVSCLSSKNANNFVRPLTKGTITSEWGYRVCPVHGREIHSGIDIGVSMNTPVYASAPGTVSGITTKSSCGGNIVTINHIIKGKQYRSVYMHLASINVKIGQVVDITTVIGKSGGGGYTLKKNGGWDTCSTGAHLHFTIREGWSGSNSVNPRNFVNFPSKGKSFSSRF